MILLALALAITVTAQDLDADVYLQDGETISIACITDGGNRTYNATNQGGELVVTETTRPPENGSWSPWSPWWVMLNAPPDDSTGTMWIFVSFGGQVEVTSSHTNYTFDLTLGWSTITAPKDISIFDITVIYRGKEMTWTEAYKARIIYKYAVTMDNKRVTYLYEGTQYQFYAYRECSIIM